MKSPPVAASTSAPEYRPETGHRLDHLRMMMTAEPFLDITIELGHLRIDVHDLHR